MWAQIAPQGVILSSESLRIEISLVGIVPDDWNLAPYLYFFLKEGVKCFKDVLKLISTT